MRLGTLLGSWLRPKLGTTLGSISRTELRQTSGTRHGFVTESTNWEILGLLVESKLERLSLLLLDVRAGIIVATTLVNKSPNQICNWNCPVPSPVPLGLW